MPGTAAAGLRAWARGDYAQEAGVELLVRAFGGRFARVGCPWVKACSRPGWFWLDVSVLLDHTAVCSGGERRVVAVVAGLVDGRPVDLGDVLAGLDRDAVALVLAAMSHAAGTHEQAELVHHGGDGIVFAPLTALVPWPTPVGRAA